MLNFFIESREVKEKKSICTSTIRFFLILSAHEYIKQQLFYQFIKFTSDSCLRFHQTETTKTKMIIFKHSNVPCSDEEIVDGESEFCFSEESKSIMSIPIYIYSMYIFCVYVSSFNSALIFTRYFLILHIHMCFSICISVNNMLKKKVTCYFQSVYL